MFVRVGVVALCLLPLLPRGGVSQAARDTVYLDLAAPVVRQPIEPSRRFLILIQHRIPVIQYEVRIRREPIEIPRLEIPVQGPAGLAPCPTRQDLAGNLKVAQTEEDVADAIQTIWHEHRVGPGCTPTDSIAIASEAWKAMWPLSAFSLRKGTKLTVEITRLESGDVDSKTWEFTLATGAPGEWRVSYGFTFATFFLNEDRVFFSKVNPDTAKGGFLIMRKRDTKDFDLAPSVLFTWLPGGMRGRPVAPSLAAGLGYRPDLPQVFAGFALTVWENVTFTTGFMVHEVRRLNGQFEEGQLVETNLTEDALSEEVFRPNWYFGLAFRLTSNPFSGRGEPEEEESGGP